MATTKKNKGHENLIPQNKRTKAEQRRIAVKGGKASGEARRRKKLLKECLEALLQEDFVDRKGNKSSGAEALASTVFKKALAGDLKAFELVRDTAGQKPVDKVMIADVDQSVIDEVEKMVMEDEE
jgi:hypothetical protein